jgi:hypothetical protein
MAGSSEAAFAADGKITLYVAPRKVSVARFSGADAIPKRSPSSLARDTAEDRIARIDGDD